MTKGKAVPANASRGSSRVEIHLGRETLADLDALAEQLDCTREHLIETAVLRFVGEEAPIDPMFKDLPPYRSPELDWEAIDRANASMESFVKKGEEAIDRSEWISHEDLVAELKARYGKKHVA
jgi:predicted transcriptional regulator